jgi:septal ring factor EnvC (AmiA/AmiB activator)
MNRTKGIIIAGTLTGLLLITILALGLGKVGAKSPESALPTTNAPEVTASDATNEQLRQELKAWQEYSQQLEQTVRIMQGREAQYQQQLESANQVIVQLQDQINRGNTIRPRSFFEENESHEFGEFDD